MRVAFVSPVKTGWNDIGSWDTIADLEFDAEDGVVSGSNAASLNCNNCPIEDVGPLVAAITREDS